jgi:hypothetical protein
MADIENAVLLRDIVRRIAAAGENQVLHHLDLRPFRRISRFDGTVGSGKDDGAQSHRRAYRPDSGRSSSPAGAARLSGGHSPNGARHVGFVFNFTT